MNGNWQVNGATDSGKIIWGWLKPVQKWAMAIIKNSGFTWEQLERTLPYVEEPDDKYVLCKLPTDGKFREMAVALKELWPEGMREINGKKYQWSDTVTNLEHRLKKLWVVRELDKYTFDDVMECAAEYVASFVDDPTYMQSLPSWIFKITEEDGARKQKSMLADLLQERKTEDDTDEDEV